MSISAIFLKDLNCYYSIVVIIALRRGVMSIITCTYIHVLYTVCIIILPAHQSPYLTCCVRRAPRLCWDRNLGGGAVIEVIGVIEVIDGGG